MTGGWVLEAAPAGGDPSGWAALLAVAVLLLPLGGVWLLTAWADEKSRTRAAIQSLLNPPASTEHPWCAVCGKARVQEGGQACGACVHDFSNKLEKWRRGLDGGSEDDGRAGVPS